ADIVGIRTAREVLAHERFGIDQDVFRRGLAGKWRDCHAFVTSDLCGRAFATGVGPRSVAADTRILRGRARRLKRARCEPPRFANDQWSLESSPDCRCTERAGGQSRGAGRTTVTSAD